MRTQLALLGLIALAAVSGVYLFNQETLQSTVDVATYQKFVQWKAAHNKNYNDAEELYRFSVFSSNLELINQTNAQGKSYTLGLTLFADLTNDEYRNLMLSNIIPSNAPVTYSSSSNGSLKSIDWRQKGAVTDVKNQGQCGSCWAFASTACLESLNQIQGGELTSFSDQQITSCTNIPIPGAGGCNGGNTFFGWNYTKKNGIVTDAQYPYTSGTTGQDGTCKTDLPAAAFKNSGQGKVAANDPQAMNDQLQEQPVAVSVDAGSFAFQLYSGGVLSSESCGIQLNHAITAVGYSSDLDAWIVKNSWGASWGMQGYVQIAQSEGNGVCGINMDVSYPINKK